MKLNETDAHNLTQAVGLLKQAQGLVAQHRVRRGSLDAGFRMVSDTAPTQLGFLDLALELTSPSRPVSPFSAAVHEVSWLVIKGTLHLYVRGDIVHPDTVIQQHVEMRASVTAPLRPTAGPVHIAHWYMGDVKCINRKGDTRRRPGTVTLSLIKLAAPRPIGAVPILLPDGTVGTEQR